MMVSAAPIGRRRDSSMDSIFEIAINSHFWLQFFTFSTPSDHIKNNREKALKPLKLFDIVAPLEFLDA